MKLNNPLSHLCTVIFSEVKDPQDVTFQKSKRPGHGLKQVLWVDSPVPTHSIGATDATPVDPSKQVWPDRG